MSESNEGVENVADRTVEPVKSQKFCGLIMPISRLDGCSKEHWGEVKSIVEAAIEPLGFTVRLVSQSDSVSFIHKTIVQNLYSDEIVVCDVSGKNPNVMFELGIRLTFDKPTVVIKDDQTEYSFDTSPIEHVPYPRSLHYYGVLSFQKTLASKVESTVEAAKNNPKYSAFLKHMGDFAVPSISETEVPINQFLLQKLDSLANSLETLRPKFDRSESFTQSLTLGNSVGWLSDAAFFEWTDQVLRIVKASGRRFASEDLLHRFLSEQTMKQFPPDKIGIRMQMISQRRLIQRAIERLKLTSELDELIMVSPL
jgi:hypothetical protein